MIGEKMPIQMSNEIRAELVFEVSDPSHANLVITYSQLPASFRRLLVPAKLSMYDVEPLPLHPQTRSYAVADRFPYPSFGPSLMMTNPNNPKSLHTLHPPPPVYKSFSPMLGLMSPLTSVTYVRVLRPRSTIYSGAGPFRHPLCEKNYAIIFEIQVMTR